MAFFFTSAMPFFRLPLGASTIGSAGTWLEAPMSGEGEKLRKEHNGACLRRVFDHKRPSVVEQHLLEHTLQYQKCAAVLQPCSRLFAGITRCQGTKDVNRLAEIETAPNPRSELTNLPRLKQELRHVSI